MPDVILFQTILIGWNLEGGLRVPLHLISTSTNNTANIITYIIDYFTILLLYMSGTWLLVSIYLLFCLKKRIHKVQPKNKIIIITKGDDDSCISPLNLLLLLLFLIS